MYFEAHVCMISMVLIKQAIQWATIAHLRACKASKYFEKFSSTHVSKKSRKDEDTIFPIMTYLGILDSGYNVVCHPNWPQLEYINDIMHFLLCKFKKIGSKQEKVETLIFRHSRVANSVVSN